jgi:signal transduction histidine kinase
MGSRRYLAGNGETVSFRRKLLLIFALTVFLSVAAVGWIVSILSRRAFERASEDRTLALVKQFEREFNRRGEDVVHRVEAIAASESVAHMAVAVTRGAPDYGAYLSQAKSIAESQRLDFLEFVDSEGTIVSSAHAPAKFGYKESALNFTEPISKEAYLKQEDVPDGAALGLFAIRAVTIGDKALYVIGGRRLDKDFLASLDLPSGMRALLYQNFAPTFSPQFLIDPSGTVQQPEKLSPVVQKAQQQAEEQTTTIHWSSDPADDESMHAIPLRDRDRRLLGVLLVGNSQRSYVELEHRITLVALLVGGAGILLAVLLSGWTAGRVTRPVEQLAQAARQVGEGDWNTQVEVQSSDELGELAESFNHMTRELLEQRERLVQTERVAAWRELARRLAHELKNPLFPLQLTVENLLRARQQSPEAFEEMFQESTATLLAEIANLRSIIGRFGEFSKMPQPQLQRVNPNEIMQGVARLFEAQLQSQQGGIKCSLDLDDRVPMIAADPDLLHRAISNLVLNAMDAMPRGGALTLRTRHEDERVRLEVCDTGTGLTPEECERLFTPYYTSKQHGTGLGLAIVQSVVSDHGGKISLESAPGRGSTFRIELPLGTDNVSTAQNQANAAKPASLI